LEEGGGRGEGGNFHRPRYKLFSGIVGDGAGRFFPKLMYFLLPCPHPLALNYQISVLDLFLSYFINDNRQPTEILTVILRKYMVVRYIFRLNS
jgi:hypothetical protein